jgi:hypothetical protein
MFVADFKALQKYGLGWAEECNKIPVPVARF